MARHHRRRKHRIAEMNVVPYIDVMLVLLIIFMITSPLLTEGVDVELPKADQGSEPLESAEVGQLIIVSVDSEGAYYLQDEDIAIDKNTLLTRVVALARTQAQGQKTRVLVKADKKLAYGKVMAVMDILKSAGIINVALVTQSN